MSMEALVKRLGRELHKAASDIETDETHDHAEQQANYGAAKALRAVADTIGYVMIGTEDFTDTDDLLNNASIAVSHCLNAATDEGIETDLHQAKLHLGRASKRAEELA